MPHIYDDAYSVQCSHCNVGFFPEEICATCRRCSESCCSCRLCVVCNVPVSLLERADNFCGRCLTCKPHCKCWMCNTCSVNFVENPTEFCPHCKRCHSHCTEMICEVNGHKSSRRGFCPNCSRCKEHCRCLPCPRCERRFPPKMVNRGNQYGVVQVEVSPFHTQARSEDEDEPCGLCKHCCRCYMVGVEFRGGKFQMYHAVFAKGQFKRNPLRRHISVELEVDGVSDYKRSTKVNRAIDKWQDPVVRDGSLGATGFEINTNPCNGDLFLDHIKELCDGLAVIDGRVSTACGMHVHINVKGTPLVRNDGTPVTRDGELVYDPRSAYTHYDLRKLILLYYKVEPALFGLVKPYRLSSRYCKPCGKFYLVKNSVAPKDFRKAQVEKLYRKGLALPESVRGAKKAKFIRGVKGYDDRGNPIYGMIPVRDKNKDFKRIGKELRSNKQQKYAEVRYNALNLHSFFMRGTIEFRHKEGTIKYDEIVNWSLICGYLVEAASKMTEMAIKALPNEPKEAMLHVIPKEFHSYMEAKWKEYEGDMPRMQQIVNDSWQNRDNAIDF